MAGSDGSGVTARPGRGPEALRREVRAWLPEAATFALSCAVAFNGLNNAFGQPLLFLLCGAVLALLLVLIPPSTPFWRNLAPVVALVCAAYAWATAPLWAGALVAPLQPRYLLPDLLLVELLGAAALLMAFLSGAILATRRGSLGVAIDRLLLFACANALLGMLLRDHAAALPWHLWQPRAGVRFTGTMSNSNVTGAYFAMMALLGAGRIAASPARWNSPEVRTALVARGLAVLLCAGACLVTASRSANACLAVGMAVILLASLRKQRRQWLPLAGLLAGGALVALAFGLPDLLGTRWSNVAGGGGARLTMWRHYGAVAAQSPWFGFGLGGFSAANANTLTDPVLAQLLWTVNSPHNLVLQLVLEGGMGFLILLSAAALLIARWSIASLVERALLVDRLGVMLAILAAIACTMVDIALDVPAIAALTLFLAGLLSGQRGSGSGRHLLLEHHASAAETRHRPGSQVPPGRSDRGIPHAGERTRPLR